MPTAATSLTQTSYSLLGGALHWLEDAFFPRRCLGCGRWGAWCCPACLASLTFRRMLACPACGTVSELGAFCESCRGQHTLQGLWSAQPYGNPLVRAMVRAVKFEGVTELIPTLGNLLTATLRTYALPPAWHHVPRERWYLTPIPLYHHRARTRGFNQAALLAAYVGDQSSLAVASVLSRVRATNPQSELTRDEERLRNVAGSFAVALNTPVAGNAYILIDDVYTSGATMNECARVLVAAGAAEVWGLTVAKG